VENGGGSTEGLARLNAASFSDAWGCACLCFVVDACGRDAGTARAMLGALAAGQPRKPIVVAAAKADAEGCMSASELFDAYELQSVGEGRLFKVVAVSALSPDDAPAGGGLGELLQFFSTAAATSTGDGD